MQFQALKKRNLETLDLVGIKRGRGSFLVVIISGKKISE